MSKLCKLHNPSTGRRLGRDASFNNACSYLSKNWCDRCSGVTSLQTLELSVTPLSHLQKIGVTRKCKKRKACHTVTPVTPGNGKAVGAEKSHDRVPMKSCF